MTDRTFQAALGAFVSLPLIVFGSGAAAASPGGAHAPGAEASWRVASVLSGARMGHTFVVGGMTKAAHLSGPDDLTRLGNELFVAFQNGVGPQGQPASDGNTRSTVVGFSGDGRVLGQWDIAGHADGLAADPVSGRVIATVNEDADSSLFVIDPTTDAVQHYSYDRNPLPHNGGTDSVAIYRGQILISASAPGSPSAADPSPPAAPQAQYPAVYSVTLDPQTSIASVAPVFSDEATATAADGPRAGHPVTLGLTDPDSSEVVPGISPRFAGDFVLDSQGDQEQIYVSDPGGPAQKLSVLALDQAVNDTAWATDSHGVLYATNSATDSVDAVTGGFVPGTVLVAATPCDANTAPSDCSASNFLGRLDMATGHVAPSPVAGSLAPGGLLFVGSPPGRA